MPKNIIISIASVIVAVVVVGGGVVYFQHLRLSGNAPTQASLSIDGIPGQTEVKDYVWGGDTGNGSGTLEFSMLTQSTSPIFFEALTSGKHFPTATFTSKDGGKLLDDVVIVSYKTSASATSSPSDRIILTFKNIETTILEPTSSSGSTTGQPVSLPPVQTTTNSTTTSTTTASATTSPVTSATTTPGSITSTTTSTTTIVVTPPSTCPPPRSLNSDGVCSCPSGQEWSGRTCTVSND